MNAHAKDNDFRRAMAAHASGVVVVTTAVDGVQHGVTVNSMTSVSLHPPVVLVCFNESSVTGQAVKASGRFCLNILEHRQEWLSRQFVQKGVDRFQNVDIELKQGDIPAIAGAASQMICSVRSIENVGDHFVVFGDVLECAASETEPLVYWQGGYKRLAI